MSENMTWIRAFACILLFWIISVPVNGHTAEKRIALLVDNSGSMYGRCGNAACNKVMGEVKLSLKNVLPLLYAYNREQKKEQQVDVVLFLFGGIHNGREEFREIVLTQNLEQDMALLEKELVSSGSYNDTNFSLALNRASDILKSRGRASCTVFLTDATSGRPVEDMDFSIFGRTFFYSLNRNTVELDNLAERYEKNGLQAEVNYLEHGWEITSSFVKAFLMLLQPKEGNHYFFHQDLEVEQKQNTLELTKLTEASTTFHLIFHGKSAPVFKSLMFGGKKKDNTVYSTFQGPNIVTVKLKRGSPAGRYTAEFASQKKLGRVSLFGMEETPLLLLERKHGKPGITHKKNEEIVFEFIFGVINKGHPVYLTEAQNQSFSKFVHAGFRISENEGSDIFKNKADLTHFTVSHVFKPENRGDSQYTIRTGWSYLDPDPVLENEAGSFLLLKEPAQVLKLEYSSDTKDNKIWQGRQISVKAGWEGGSLLKQFSSTAAIELKDTLTGKSYHLKFEKRSQSFHGELGRNLTSGRHIFELTDPLPGGKFDISLTGKELDIAPRVFHLDIRETTERSGKTREGFFNKLKNGFLYLTGNKEKELCVEEYQVKTFPFNKEIKIPYYDSNTHVVEVKSGLSPVFGDETFTLTSEFKGPKSYSAAEASMPRFFGLFRGDQQKIEDALTVNLTPEESQVTAGTAQTVKFIKKECDWEINGAEMATSAITYTPSLTADGTEIRLEGNSMIFSFSAQSWDKEIINALRASAFIAFAVLTVFLFLVVLGFLIYLRSHSLHRQEQWEVICKMMPEDFCRPGCFPQKAYRHCEERSNEENRSPGEVLRRAVRDNDKKFLSRIYKAFSLNELKILKEKCKSSNFNSSWEFEFTGGANVTVYGSELNSSSECIRLRDFECSLPPVIGSISVRQTGNGMELKFYPRPEIVFRLKDALFIPPYNGATELQPGDVILVGRHKDELPVAMNISAYSETLVIQCKKR